MARREFVFRRKFLRETTLAFGRCGVEDEARSNRVSDSLEILDLFLGLRDNALEELGFGVFWVKGFDLCAVFVLDRLPALSRTGMVLRSTPVSPSTP